VALDVERHLGQLADRPDRVDVAEDEDLVVGILDPARRELGDDEIADVLLGMERDLRADPSELPDDERAAGVDRLLVGGRGFERDELLQQVDHLALAGAEIEAEIHRSLHRRSERTIYHNSGEKALPSS